MPSPRVTIELKSKQQLADNTLELTYVRSDGEPIRYVPGQFFSLHFPFNGEEKSRSYSAAGRVENILENREFSFVISAVPNGAASQFFFETQPGQTIEMSGPFGALTLPPADPQRYLMIATGTGVGPYRSMLPKLLERMEHNPDLQVHLVYGTRSPDTVYYRDDFETVSQQFDNFTYDICYSRDLPEQITANEHEGRVQARFEILNPSPDSDIIYLCGNPEMVENSATQFKQAGFTPKNLKQEKYRFSTF